MIITAPYLPYWIRIRKEFLSGFLIIAAVILFNYLSGKHDFGIYALMILGAGMGYIITSVIKSWTFVYEVKISDDIILVTGTYMNVHWSKEFHIKDSEIRIKSKGWGRGNNEYYVTLASNNKAVDINQSLNWDYPSLLTLFHEFKRLKGEKITIDESAFLDLMEKKGSTSSIIASR